MGLRNRFQAIFDRIKEQSQKPAEPIFIILSPDRAERLIELHIDYPDWNEEQLLAELAKENGHVN